MLIDLFEQTQINRTANIKTIKAKTNFALMTVVQITVDHALPFSNSSSLLDYSSLQKTNFIIVYNS